MSLGNRESPVCRDALDLSCAPGRNRGLGAVDRVVPTPLFSLASGNPSYFPVSSSRAPFSGAMPVWSVLSLSQKGVV